MAPAQKQWTLQDCLDYARQHNLTLQQARLKQQQAEEDVKSASAQMLPSVSANTNHSLGYRPWPENGTMTVTNGQVETKVEKSYYNGSYGINASWTLWDGNKRQNALKQNRLTAQQSELSYSETSNSIQEQIAQLYVQILYLTEARKVSEQTLETSKKNEERGKQMLEVGKMSKADVAQLTAQRASDEYTIVEAQSNIDRYTLQLRQLLKLRADDDFQLAMTQPDDQQALGQIEDLESVYSQALQSRPEIASSQIAIQSSELSIKTARAGYMPTLGLSGGIGTSTNSLSDKDWGKQMKNNFDASVGLTLSVPLFDQRQTKTSIRKAKLQREEALIELQAKEDELYKTIEGYWLDAKTNQQKFKAAIETEKSEQTSYDLLSEQFRLGLKNIVELMTGKDRLSTAQQNRLQSKYQAVLAMQMLDFYKGENIK